MTRPVCGFMLAETNHRHRLFAGRTPELPGLERWCSLFPWTRGSGLFLQPDFHIIVASTGTQVSTDQLVIAGLPTRRTFSGVTVVFHPLSVVAVGSYGAHLPTFRRSRLLLLATRNLDVCGLTVAKHFALPSTRKTWTFVAARQTFVILAIERFPAHLLTWRAVTNATLFVARMLPTIPNPFAFDVASELLGAINLLGFSPTATCLGDQL